MIRGDAERVRPGSPLRPDFGDAVGTVTEADAKDGRFSVNFPSVGCFAVGCWQEESEVVARDSQEQ